MEVCNSLHFGDSTTALEKLCGGDDDDYVSDDNDSKRIANFSNEECCWWLRSPGTDSCTAAIVGEYGCVIVDGHYVVFAGGVRPVLWLEL
jgi:hypothetical protein